jgi:hypothetical protein
VGNIIREQVAWSLHGNRAELSCGILSARIDVARPQLGLYETRLQGSQGQAAILEVHRADKSQVAAMAAGHYDAIEWPLPLAEAYVRGGDLVATYRAIDDWPFSPQLYWRSNSLAGVDGVLASVSLLVSVQTHLLDTCPQIGAASQLPQGALLVVSFSGNASPRVEPVERSRTVSASGENLCIVSRFRDRPMSYVEIMPPGDFREIALRSDAVGNTIEWRLFAEFLEKGVIRRARVHAALISQENDLEIAAKCCAETDRLELPLTT